MARGKVKDTGLPKRQKRILFLIGFVGLLTFVAGIALAGYAGVNYKYERAIVKDKGVFTVPKGAGLSSIADRLEADGYIDSAFVFKLVTKMRGNEGNFKAGEFGLDANASMAKIYDELSSGRSIQYPFTAPEGMTSAQIVRALDGVATLVDDNPAVPTEGSLLPETYLTPRGMTQSDVLKLMKSAQTKVLDQAWDNRQADLPIKSKREALILASIVEKETGIGGERREVAGVFINRLRKGMRLQSDPTIIYGITKGEPLGRRIRRSEINAKTDWNTYQMSGLPKTPICNPGAEAIRAVLDPMETEMLYFVADGTGGHVFAKTLREHQRNVQKWYAIRRSRGEM